MSVSLSHTDLTGLAERAIRATLGGSLADLTALVHPDAVNREAIAEPPATRGVGPAAFHATGEWLRAAFSDLVWTTERDVVDNNLVVTYGTLSGRQTSDFVVWTPDGAVERAFAPTGKTFTVRQAHFQQVLDGLVIEHWAVRDDQGLALQLGWIPPTPGFPPPLPPRHETSPASQPIKILKALRDSRHRSALGRRPMPRGDNRGHIATS